MKINDDYKANVQDAPQDDEECVFKGRLVPILDMIASGEIKRFVLMAEHGGGVINAVHLKGVSSSTSHSFLRALTNVVGLFINNGKKGEEGDHE